MEKCPNCGQELFKRLMSKNELLSQDKVNFINQELNLNSSGYCDECGKKLLFEIEFNYSNADTSISTLRKIDAEINKQLDFYIKQMPAVTLEIPFEWEYTSISFVSSQIVVGTGVVAEIASDITDFFGLKSNIYAEKVSKGEKYCLDMLRINSFAVGGNAVLGVRMSYGQAGGAKGMLMICATATAVKLHNFNIEEKMSPDAAKLARKLGAYKEEIHRALNTDNIGAFYEIYNGKIMSEAREAFKI